MPSPFASQTQSDPIPLPFDPPHTITVRKLTGREIERAQQAHRDGLTTGNARSWAVTFRRMLEKGASDPEVLKVLADPLTGYDRYELVRAGLVAWSYPQPITADRKALGDPAVDAIDDLDDEAVDFIATEVLRLTKPALFYRALEDAEAAQKKADGPAPRARREGAATV
jgi:hypothetical protein